MEIDLPKKGREEILGEENSEGGRWKILDITEDDMIFQSKIEEIKKHKKVVLTSGYFDPLHHGHIELFKLSKELGDYLVVVVNNDIQTKIKKGYVFMTAKDKAKIIKELACVDDVFISIDGDHSQCNTLTFLKPHIFSKGGDRYTYEIPETPTCRKYGIEIIDGVGEKVESSSRLVKGCEENKNSEQ